MQLLPYAILDMDGTLLDSSGMWDDVARDLLAQWNAVYTPRQGDDTMTMTIDGCRRLLCGAVPSAGHAAGTGTADP